MIGLASHPQTMRGVHRRQAKDVEDLLVWTFRDHRAIEVLRNTAPVARLGYGTDSTIKCERAARLGVLTDYTGRPAQELPLDAEAIHDAVLRIPDKTQRALLISHARIGERPCAMVNEVPRWHRMLNRNGRPAMGYDRNGRAIVCWIEWDLSHDDIEFARRVYSIWHTGLQHVAAMLAINGVLDDFVVTGPRATARPWETNEEHS